MCSILCFWLHSEVPSPSSYANRLRNGMVMVFHTAHPFSEGSSGTFSIPIIKDRQPGSSNVYTIPTNDRDGKLAGFSYAIVS